MIKTGNRFFTIDVLRLAAIVMVVAWHTGFGVKNDLVYPFMLNHVPILVAVSFFLCDDFGRKYSAGSIGQFVGKRFFRLYRLVSLWTLIWIIFMPGAQTTDFKRIVLMMLIGSGILYFLPLLFYLIIWYSGIRLGSLVFKNSRPVFYLAALLATFAAIVALKYLTIFPGTQVEEFVKKMAGLAPYGLIGLGLRDLYCNDAVFLRKKSIFLKTLAALALMILAYFFSLLNANPLMGIFGTKGYAYHGISRMVSVTLIFYSALLFENIGSETGLIKGWFEKLAKITPGVFCIHSFVWVYLNKYFYLERNGTWLTLWTILLSFTACLLLKKSGKFGSVFVT